MHAPPKMRNNVVAEHRRANKQLRTPKKAMKHYKCSFISYPYSTLG